MFMLMIRDEDSLRRKQSDSEIESFKRYYRSIVSYELNLHYPGLLTIEEPKRDNGKITIEIELRGENA